MVVVLIRMTALPWPVLCCDSFFHTCGVIHAVICSCAVAPYNNLVHCNVLESGTNSMRKVPLGVVGHDSEVIIDEKIGGAVGETKEKMAETFYLDWLCTIKRYVCFTPSFINLPHPAMIRHLQISNQ